MSDTAFRSMPVRMPSVMTLVSFFSCSGPSSVSTVPPTAQTSAMQIAGRYPLQSRRSFRHAPLKSFDFSGALPRL